MVVQSDAPRSTNKASWSDLTCPACYQAKLRIFFEADDVPTNSCILLDTVAEARGYPRGDIRLGFCSACGFVFNAAFDPKKTEYSERYEETQAWSGTFNRFHKALAERLIEKYHLRGRNVLEIGCGKGEFLMLLAELGDIRGVGIDPGVRVERITGPAANRVKFIADFYSEKYADHRVDLLACKMTLEHIPNPGQFISTVRAGLGDQAGTTVFFQIPEALRILRDCAFEDVYYEHCAYFTPGSLARLFRRGGFDVLDLQTEYAGQYLTIEAKPRTAGAAPSRPLPLESDLEEVARLVSTFAGRCEAKLAPWRLRLEAARREGKTIALWGSGSKAVSYLTTLNAGELVRCVTDINPYRHNHFMPKTGHRIVPPQELVAIRPDVVVVMNEVYEAEIRESLKGMGLTPQVVSL
jgi:SAM-dependent methyltransferase